MMNGLGEVESQAIYYCFECLESFSYLSEKVSLTMLTLALFMNISENKIICYERIDWYVQISCSFGMAFARIVLSCCGMYLVCMNNSHDAWNQEK